MALVLLSLGSNIERERHLRAAVAELQRVFGFLRLSPVYESDAVGFDGPPFYNLVAAFDSDTPPMGISSALKETEDHLGRSREGERFASRTIDIDLLTWGDLCLEGSDLQLPRDEILQRAFVLKPLADIAGDRVHPVLGRSYAALWEQFGGDRRLRRVDFDWDEGY